MKIYLSTLGCKLNESELEAWARRFTNDGHEIVNDARAADVIVLNTCTVTRVAARKTRQLARQLARANPHARIVLTGCFVTISPDEARALPSLQFLQVSPSSPSQVPQGSPDFLNSLSCPPVLKNKTHPPLTRTHARQRQVR